MFVRRPGLCLTHSRGPINVDCSPPLLRCERRRDGILPGPWAPPSRAHREKGAPAWPGSDFPGGGCSYPPGCQEDRAPLAPRAARPRGGHRPSPSVAPARPPLVLLSVHLHLSPANTSQRRDSSASQSGRQCVPRRGLRGRRLDNASHPEEVFAGGLREPPTPASARRSTAILSSSIIDIPCPLPEAASQPCPSARQLRSPG